MTFRTIRTRAQTRLNVDTYPGEAHWAFETAVTNLRAHGYTATFDNLSVDEVADAVTVDASGTIRLFYNLLPPVTVHTSATSEYRVWQR